MLSSCTRSASLRFRIRRAGALSQALHAQPRSPHACRAPRRGFCVTVMASDASGAAAGGSKPRRVVVWFRNDLRLHDNYALHAAVKEVVAKQADEVLPVYCWDPRFFQKSVWGTPKMGVHRARFLMESVEDLKARLRAAGSDLLVAVGKPEEVLAGLAAGGGGGGPTTVFTQEEVTSEELAVDARVARALKPSGGRLVRVWGSSLYHLDDLPFPDLGRDLPDVFTPFREKVERKAQVRPDAPTPKAGDLPLPTGLTPQQQAALAAPPTWQQLPWAGGQAPAAPAQHPSAVLPFKGGETAALARLKYYLWDSDLLFNYFNTRNGMLGGDYSTKFAPWMAAGCLSPRRIHNEIRKYEGQRGANKSTYWAIFELIWRDFFKFFALKHGNAIFFEQGTSGLPLVWNRDDELFSRWREGKTGLPLVDANMRELAATGFMSNRGRQNVASYLALDVGTDWRRGADWFEHILLDYDVASNWGNWVAAAGLTGGRLNHFNITKQSKDYDPEGDYIRTWVPELKAVPTSRIHEPWLMSRDEQAKYGVQIGADYPNPIPASRLGKPHGGGGGGGRGGRGGGRGGRRDGKRNPYERYS